MSKLKSEVRAYAVATACLISVSIQARFISEINVEANLVVVKTPD